MGLRFFTPLRYVQNDMVESAASMDSGFRRNDEEFPLDDPQCGDGIIGHHFPSWQSWFTPSFPSLTSLFTIPYGFRLPPE